MEIACADVRLSNMGKPLSRADMIAVERVLRIQLGMGL